MGYEAKASKGLLSLTCKSFNRLSVSPGLIYTHKHKCKHTHTDKHECSTGRNSTISIFVQVYPCKSLFSVCVCVCVCVYGLQGSEDFDSCSNRMEAGQQQNTAELQQAWLSQCWVNREHEGRQVNKLLQMLYCTSVCVLETNKPLKTDVSHCTIYLLFDLIVNQITMSNMSGTVENHHQVCRSTELCNPLLVRCFGFTTHLLYSSVSCIIDHVSDSSRQLFSVHKL